MINYTEKLKKKKAAELFTDACRKASQLMHTPLMAGEKKTINPYYNQNTSVFTKLGKPQHGSL